MPYPAALLWKYPAALLWKYPAALLCIIDDASKPLGLKADTSAPTEHSVGGGLSGPFATRRRFPDASAASARVTLNASFTCAAVPTTWIDRLCGVACRPKWLRAAATTLTIWCDAPNCVAKSEGFSQR